MIQRKKILFIHESLDGGGAEKVFVDMLARFDRRSYDITLLLLFGGGTHTQSLPEDIRVITLWTGKHRGLRWLRWHFLATRDVMLRQAVCRALEGKYFDTIASFLEGPALKAHSFVLDCAKRNVTWVHANLETNHWSSYMFADTDSEAAVYRKMDAIAFVSEGARDAFKRQFGISEKLHIVHNIIDTPVIRQKAAEPLDEASGKRPVIINVGRLEVQKRQDRLLHVVSILKQRGLDFEVWLLGTGRLEKDLKSLALRLGVSDRVRFLGFQSNPYKFMRAATLFLLTSDTEGRPTVVCEALSVGLPVVSTRVTGAEELLGGGIGVLTGLEPEEIAAAVEPLLGDYAVLARMRDNALHRASEFDPEAVLSQIYSLI